MVSSVIIDGADAGKISSYTFTDVTEGHSVSVSFTEAVYEIEVGDVSNGTISTDGSGSVGYGDSITYTFEADDGCEIVDVIVDGVSVGNVSSYTFSDITGDHTLYVAFGEEGCNKVTVITNEGNDPDSDVVVNGIHVTNGTVVSIDDNTLNVVPDEWYYITGITVNGIGVDVSEGKETEVAVDLPDSVDALVVASIEKIYDVHSGTQSDVTVSGDEIRYDASLIVTPEETVEDDWDIVWEDYSDSNLRETYEVEIVTVSGKVPFYETLTISVDVGTQYDNYIAMVFHKDSATGSIESFEVVVEDGMATVVLNSLSPILVIISDEQDSGNGTCCMCCIALWLILLVIILAEVIIAMYSRHRWNVKEEKNEDRSE
ncbi:MAG: hypothetical protein WCR17_00935 [Candidatus Methanomethylophilaceae archaeon]